MPGRQKLAIVLLVLALFVIIGAWANAPSPDAERVNLEMAALKMGYEQQIQHAFNEAIDALAVKGRQHSRGSFQRHLDGIRTAYKDCRDIIQGK